MREQLRARLSGAALGVAVLLTATNGAFAGTVTKTFPDIEGQVRLFLSLPLGMTHREFR